MEKKNEEIPSYTIFNSFSNSNVTPFNKLIAIIFFIYIFLTFSDEGLINALSEQIISEYNLSREKYSLIKIVSCFGQISCSFALLKLIKKIIHYYKYFCTSSLLIKSVILISYNFNYSFSIFLLTRFISNFIRLFEFVYFMSWFAQQMKKPIFGMFGLLMTLLIAQIGNAFGYYFYYLNIEIANNEKWRNIFLRMGTICLIYTFLLTLVNSKEFKLKKNIYYPSSRFGKNIENNNINNHDINSPESSERSNSYSILNLDTLNKIKNKLEKLENKYNLYDLSLEEKLKKISVSEFDYFSELKSMISNRIYLFSLISLSLLFLIYYTILFWSNDFIINYLQIKEPNSKLINYISISFFAPSLGIALNRAVQFTVIKYKKGYNLLSMLIGSFSLCVVTILIQTEALFEFILFFFIIYISYIFYLLPSVIMLHLKYTQFTFKKEDFIFIILSKNLCGEIIGNLIYIFFSNDNDTMSGMGMIINMSWILLGVLGFTLVFEFNTAEKKPKKRESNDDGDRKIKNYRMTITSELQGEELKDIDLKENIINVDDNDNDDENNINKEKGYSLDDYIKK
jgi:hypothetical protein